MDADLLAAQNQRDTLVRQIAQLNHQRTGVEILLAELNALLADAIPRHEALVNAIEHFLNHCKNALI